MQCAAQHSEIHVDSISFTQTRVQRPPVRIVGGRAVGRDREERDMRVALQTRSRTIHHPCQIALFTVPVLGGMPHPRKHHDEGALLVACGMVLAEGAGSAGSSGLAVCGKHTRWATVGLIFMDTVRCLPTKEQSQIAVRWQMQMQIVLQTVCRGSHADDTIITRRHSLRSAGSMCQSPIPGQVAG